MDGIGKTHFPITTSVPEVQEWFDQGHTLLHSYWFYEAERAFRWCLKLDPECAMAYWGLYRCVPGSDPTAAEPDKERAATFLQEAAKRKHLVTDRERMYIDAWQARVSTNAPGAYSAETIAAHAEFKQRLERIILKYPDDVEARALYANENLPSSVVGKSTADTRYANELVVREILQDYPEH